LGEIATKRYALPDPSVPLIHLDAVAEEIGRWRRVDVGLWGDARAGLEDLCTALGRSTPTAREYYEAEVSHRKESWHASVGKAYASRDGVVSMAALFGALNAVSPADAIVVTDGGFASHWGGLFYDTKLAGRGFVADRGFASIGYGLPGAVGASLASERPVVGVTGDGGLNMSLGTLETAIRTGVSFTLLVVNNAASGYVKALQHSVYGTGAYQSSDLVELDYSRLADAFGCRGFRVDESGELESAIQRGLGGDGPTIVDVVVTRDPAEMLPGVDHRAAAVSVGDHLD
jgi:acetolactate synthase-1/2/3 large subunit